MWTTDRGGASFGGAPVISAGAARRGEIWLVDFNPTAGAEIRKVRPAVIVSSDAVGRLPLRLVAPVTGWKEAFEDSFWHVKITPDSLNGLTKESAVDVLQLRGVDVARFEKRLGRASARVMEAIVTAIAGVVEYM